MGFFSELKLKNKCKREGRMQEYNDYRFALKSVLNDIDRYTQYVNNANEILESAKQNFTESSPKYIDAKNEVNRWKQTLDDRKLRLRFIRPNTKEDISYRCEHGNKFISELRSVISPDLDLRFHGTPIYFAEQIIKSASISSSADRYDGYMKSTDMKGEISASTIKTFDRTLNFFSDMHAYDSCMPAGCIFALLPKDREDANYAYDMMRAVDFKKNPEQLFGVFTTPENVDRVKKWMEESGLDSEKAYTFEGFIEAVKEKSAIIDEKNAFRRNLESKNISNGVIDIVNEQEDKEQENSSIEQDGVMEQG